MYVELGRGREQKREGGEKAQRDEFAAYLAASDLHIVSEEIEVESRKRESLVLTTQPWSSAGQTVRKRGKSY